MAGAMSLNGYLGILPKAFQEEFQLADTHLRAISMKMIVKAEKLDFLTEGLMKIGKKGSQTTS